MKLLSSLPLNLLARTHLLLAFISLLLSAPVVAIPVPLGIDGTVYELDGLTPVRNGVDFSVTNLNTGEVVAGKTGRGSPGRYSATVGGSNGHSLLVKAWNKYNSANFTITASGVIHNAHFVLNMTYPPLAPTITTPTLPQATEDTPYESLIEAFDENEDMLLYTLQTPLPGLWLDSATGMLSWTPGNDDVGNHTVMVSVSDGVHISNASYTLEVIGVNDAPAIFSLPTAYAMEDALYQYDVDALDVDSPSLEYALLQSPIGMSIDTVSGMLSWLPTNDDVGTHTIRVAVSDGMLADEQQYVLAVENVNDFPYITSLPPTTVEEDSIFTYTPLVTDVDSSQFAFSLAEIPNGMTINTTTGALHWLPTNDDVGIHHISIVVSDGEGSTTQEFALLVLNVNDPPVVVSTPPTTAAVGQEYSYAIVAQDIDGDILAYILTEAPSGAALDSASGELSWKPKGSQIGMHNFKIVVSDGNLSVEHAFTVTVAPPSEQKNSPRGGGGGGGAGGGGRTSIAKGETTAGESTASGSENSNVEQPPLSPSQLQEVISKLKRNDVLVLPETQNAIVKILSQRPAGTTPLPAKVYNYLQIDNSAQAQQNHHISFRLRKKWLSDSSVLPQDISLMRYVDGVWTHLATQNVSADDSYAYYLAETPGFSYFAISVKEGVSPTYAFAPEISTLKLPYTIAGAAYSFGRLRQVSAGTVVTLENLDTSEKIELSTGAGQHSGAYIGTLAGTPGQRVKVTIGTSSTTITLSEDSIILLDFVKKLFGKGFAAVRMDEPLQKILSSLLGLFLFMALVLFVIIITQRVKEMRAKNP